MAVVYIQHQIGVSRTAEDSFHDLRHDLFDFILSNNMRKEFLAHIANKSATPLSQRRQWKELVRNSANFFGIIPNLLIGLSGNINLCISRSCMHYREDIPLFPCLVEGVSTGFHNDVPPSNCFPVNDNLNCLRLHFLFTWRIGKVRTKNLIPLVIWWMRKLNKDGFTNLMARSTRPRSSSLIWLWDV